MMKKIYKTIIPKTIRTNIRKYIEFNKVKSKRKDKNHAFYKFDETKSIFIHIPKAGGISIIKSLYGNEVNGFGHPTFHFFKNLYKNDFNNYFKFTFVRNPWDRIYSAYVFLKKGGLNEMDKNFYENYLKKYRSFENFVLEGLEKKEILEWIHFIPQYKFIYDKKEEKIVVDFIGRFENFNEDFLKIAKKVNPNAKLKHMNKTKKNDSYKDIYTPEMIKKIKEIYSKDIELFNYSFN